VLKVVGRDADSAISHGETSHAMVHGQLDPYPTTIGVACGIAEQVKHQLGQPRPIADHLHALYKLEVNTQALGGEE
jgi:hypothetical protein